MKKIGRSAYDSVPDYETKTNHSGAYHRFFEGYSEAYVTDAKGRRTIARVYTGTYYRLDAEDHQWKLRKLQYALLLAAAIVLFIAAAAQPVAFNRSWYGGVGEAVSVFLFILSFIAVVNYAAAPREMIVRQYRKSSENLIRYALPAAVCLLLCAVLALVHLLFVSSADTGVTILSAVGFALSGLSMLVLYRMESLASYTRTKSKEKAPEDSVEII